jgi:hypothetical protein
MENPIVQKCQARHISMILVLSASMIMLEPRSSAARYGEDGSLSVCRPVLRANLERFRAVMKAIADGWNQGNATLAASCFAEDAMYSSPPSPSRNGRKALYEYFGGATGRDMPMHMAWHHLVFDPVAQIGVGEYTFRSRIQTHGLVIVKLSNGLIRHWREYEVASDLSWRNFVGGNAF